MPYLRLHTAAALVAAGGTDDQGAWHEVPCLGLLLTVALGKHFAVSRAPSTSPISNKPWRDRVWLPSHAVPSDGKSSNVGDRH